MKKLSIITIIVLAYKIFLAGNLFADPLDSLNLLRTPEITPIEIFLHIEYLASDKLEGRFPGTSGDLLARTHIANEFSEAGLTPAGDSSYFQFFTINKDLVPDATITAASLRTTNVIGYLEGSDPVLKNEVIVIGAHYDHLGFTRNYNDETSEREIHNGADDNASGTTGVMELAEKIAAHKDLFKRSFIFICFSGEEEGLIGSAIFTKSELFKKYNIVAMFNFDMIGRLSKNTLILNGTGTSPIWNGLIDEVNTSYNFNISKNPGGTGGSDHTSFTLKKIPALFFFTGLHDDYHQPTDDFWKINIEGEAKVLNYAYDIVEKVANLNSEPIFTITVNTENESSKNEGFISYVGTIPDFTSTDEGFRIAGVKSGSPGDKAGLKQGDLMIKFGDVTVKNINDYTAALKKYKPGDTVDITILRDGKELICTCTLGKR